MTEDTGLHGQADRGLTITIGAGFVERHGEAGAIKYAQTIASVAAAHRGASEDELATALTDAFRDSDTAIPRIELQRLAEQLHGARGELTIVNPDGVALVGDQALALDGQAYEDRTEDPEQEDRPTYS